jgi:hypothetical protein
MRPRLSNRSGAGYPATRLIGAVEAGQQGTIRPLTSVVTRPRSARARPAGNKSRARPWGLPRNFQQMTLARRHQVTARLCADVLKRMKHDVGALENETQSRRSPVGVERTMHKNGASRLPMELHLCNGLGLATHISDPNSGVAASAAPQRRVALRSITADADCAAARSTSTIPDHYATLCKFYKSNASSRWIASSHSLRL